MALKILLVDDDIAGRESMSEALLENISSVEIEEAADGEEALKKFKANPTDYCLVITDFQMPKMDGLHFLVNLRQINRNTPCILLTGFEAKLGETIALDPNTLVVTKPIQNASFYDSVESLILIRKNQSQKTVLLVDPSRTVHFKMKQLFKHTDFEVIDCFNMEEAANYINDGVKIDLLLTGKLLTGSDRGGIKLGEMFREKYPDLPMILLVGSIDDDTKKLAKDTGFTAYFSKDINYSDFSKIIQGAM